MADDVTAPRCTYPGPRAAYAVIVADPPWSYEDKLRMGGTVGVRRSADSHYSVMALNAIKALPVSSVCAADAVLALWCPSTLLHTHGYPTVDAWGFSPKQLYHWIKTAGGASGLAFGMGRYFRNCSETAILAVRGKPKLQNKAQRNVLLARALPHSQKPEGLQDSLELMYPRGPWLELFARRDRAGWTCVGNECPPTMGVDIRDWLGAELRLPKPPHPGHRAGRVTLTLALVPEPPHERADSPLRSL